MEENLQSSAQFTDWKGRKTFTEEWNMVRDVFEGRADMTTLETYLEPLVNIVAIQFPEMHPNKNSPQDLLKAAYMYLPQGIKTYYGVKKDKGVSYKFSTYYEWFMRQGFLDYPHNRFKKS